MALVCRMPISLLHSKGVHASKVLVHYDSAIPMKMTADTWVGASLRQSFLPDGIERLIALSLTASATITN